MNEYLRAFVIGSCFFIFFPYFFIVHFYLREKVAYVPYTFYAPVALGLFNVLSLLIAKRFQLSREQRYMTIGVIAPTLVALTVYTFNVYDYNTYGWISHIVQLYVFYALMFNVVVYLLDKYV